VANTMQVDIVSAEEAIFSGEATMVIVSAAAGDIGIAPGHAAFISPIKPGEVAVYGEGEEQHIYVSGGMVEVQPHVVTVLADTAIRGGDLDAAEAEEARRRAEEDLKQAEGTPDYAAVAQQLAEASARVAVLKKIRDVGK